MMSRLVLTVLMLAGVGCAHSIHQVHTSDFTPMSEIESGQIVRGYAEQFVILGFVKETSYVDKAYVSLMQECPKGQITGITTQLSTSMSFFSWTNKALMQGLCISSK